MTKSLLCLAILAASFATAAQAADAPAVSTNLSLTSNYKYRGQDQSANRPAVQGGFDFAHSSGFYLGNWNSSIGATDAGIEMDFYGGYKGEISKGLGFDVGLLQYYYPQKNKATDFNTTEIYGGMTFGPVTGKLSYVVSSEYFGLANGNGTVYGDITLAQPLTKALTLNLHLGGTALAGDAKSATAANYWDYKVGATYDLGSGFSMAAAVVGATRDAIWGDLNKPRFIATITKAM